MKYIKGAGGVFLVKYGVRFMKIGGYGKNRRIGQENPKIKSNDQKSYETFWLIMLESNKIAKDRNNKLQAFNGIRPWNNIS